MKWVQTLMAHWYRGGGGDTGLTWWVKCEVSGPSSEGWVWKKVVSPSGNPFFTSPSLFRSGPLFRLYPLGGGGHIHAHVALRIAMSTLGNEVHTFCLHLLLISGSNCIVFMIFGGLYDTCSIYKCSAVNYFVAQLNFLSLALDLTQMVQPWGQDSQWYP